MSPRRVLLALVAGLYLVGLGIAGGIVTERFRFDHARASRLAELDTLTSRVRAHLMMLEKETHQSAARQDAR